MEEEYFPFEYITFHLVPCLAKYISLFCITNSFRFLFFYFFLSCIMVCILLTIKKHWLSSFEISGRREILVWTTDQLSVEALYHPYQPWCLHISISIVPTSNFLCVLTQNFNELNLLSFFFTMKLKPERKNKKKR